MTQCPSCSSIERHIKGSAGQYIVVQCDCCFLNFCDEMCDTNSEDVIDTDPDFFHGLRESYNEQVNAARLIVPKRLKAYSQLLGRPVTSILEIGCATGAYATAFNEHGIRYAGLEIEADLAVQAQQNTGLDIRHGNFLDQAHFEDFDVIFASQVFEHIVTPNLFLKQACLAAPNGLIHIDVPNHGSLTSKIRKIIPNKNYGFIQPPYHMIAYDKHSLNYLVSKFGLKIDILAANSNNDSIWGQLISSKQKNLSYFIYRLSNLFGMGSLLTFVGRPNKN